MKLLKLYIENFGKLSKLELDFKDNLNEINQKNGWGKTTLASFIKVMFYGLVGNSRTDIDKNERTKYRPWQGGNFGGYLEFEVNQKQYRVTRFFLETESKDTFELINLKTNKPSADYSINLGEELFNLDVDGFERSTYINNKSLNMKDKSGIAKRLSNLIEDTNEVNNLNTALTMLDKKRQELKNKQNNGAIPDITKQIFNLNRQLEILQATAKELENKKVLSNQLKSEIVLLEENLKQITKQTEFAQKEKEVQILSDNQSSLLNKIKLAEQQVQLIEELFNNNLPSDEQVSSLEQEVLTVNKIDGIIEQHADENINDTQLDKLNHFFDNKLHYAKEIEKQIKSHEKLNVINAQLQNIKGTKDNYNKPHLPFNKKFGLNWVRLLAVILGAGLVISSKFVIKEILSLGIVLLSLGCVILLYGVVEIIRNYFKAKHAVNFNFTSTNENQVSGAENLTQEKQNIESELKSFLNIFYQPNEYENYYTALRNLQKLYDKLLFLQEQHAQTQVNIVNLKEQRQKSAEAVELIIGSYKLNESDNYNEILHIVKAKLNEHDTASKMLQQLQQELKEFEQKNKTILAKATNYENSVSYDELKSKQQIVNLQLESLKEQKTMLDSKITQLSLECEVISDYNFEKESLEEKLKEYESQFEVIKLTDKYLNQAQENITSTYLSDMKESFVKYVNLLTNEELGKFTITSDLSLKVEKYGVNYDSDYFSKGYKDILEFAMRLSLIEVLFEKDLPFIILDDPFVNLDNDKILLATSLVKEVSKKYQMLYLICHSSRSVK